MNLVSGGMSIKGRTAMIPTASAKIAPSFTKVLSAPRGASSSHTGITEAANPYKTIIQARPMAL